MSMFDSLKSKLGIDPDADSYVDDTEDDVFPGGQGGAQEYTQQEVKQHSNKVVNINATTQLQVVLVLDEFLRGGVGGHHLDAVLVDDDTPSGLSLIHI